MIIKFNRLFVKSLHVLAGKKENMKTEKLNWRLLLLLGLFLAACTPANAPLPSRQAVTETILPISTGTATATPVPTTQEIPGPTSTLESKTPAISEQTPAQPTIEITPIKTEDQTERNSMTPITISVGGSSFSAKLYDNDTTRALLAQFPLTLDMSEFNGREKYYDLPENLPSTLTEKPETIYAGEIMLWSSNTLVLFYNTFPNSYGGYVRLGYVEDVTSLAAALGSGNVQVTFDVSD